MDTVIVFVNYLQEYVKHVNIYSSNQIVTRNLAIANRSRVSYAHNTSRASIITP